MDNDAFFALAHRLADRAAEETLSRFRTGGAIANKAASGFDPVTEADREAERAIRVLIEEAFPDHRIRGEEWPDRDGDAPYRWVLDPVDGTRAFICGAPVWTTLIGLERDGVPVAGVVDQPFLKERWIGSLLGDAPRLIGPREQTATSPVSILSDARVMVTDMREGEYFSQAEAVAAARLAREVKVVRQGLDSYGFGLLASGHMDLVVEAALHWHDVAAVIPVVQAAGGTVITWQGKSLQATDDPIQIIAAATRELAEAAADVLAG